jgi:hypothetical protein
MDVLRGACLVQQCANVCEHHAVIGIPAWFIRTRYDQGCLESELGELHSRLRWSQLLGNLPAGLYMPIRHIVVQQDPTAGACCKIA